MKKGYLINEMSCAIKLEKPESNENYREDDLRHY